MFFFTHDVVNVWCGQCLCGQRNHPTDRIHNYYTILHCNDAVSYTSGSVHWVKCIPFTSPIAGAQYTIIKRVSLKNEQFLLLLLLRYKKHGQWYLELSEISLCQKKRIGGLTEFQKMDFSFFLDFSIFLHFWPYLGEQQDLLEIRWCQTTWWIFGFLYLLGISANISGTTSYWRSAGVCPLPHIKMTE